MKRTPKAYFERLAKDYPTLYIPYLALGDMYTAEREFAKAEASYRKAFSLAPKKCADYRWRNERGYRSAET